jgi:hypothetical protein
MHCDYVHAAPFPICNEALMIRVRIDHTHPIVCRYLLETTELGGRLDKTKRPRSCITEVWYDKDPSLLKGPERRA